MNLRALWKIRTGSESAQHVKTLHMWCTVISSMRQSYQKVLIIPVFQMRKEYTYELKFQSDILESG